MSTELIESNPKLTATKRPLNGRKGRLIFFKFKESGRTLADP